MTPPVANAITEALRAEGRTGMVTGFIPLAEYIDEDGDPCWFITHPEDQRLSASIGQVEWLRLVLRRGANDYFDGDDDD